MEVHQAGGGINFTVEKTREASEDQLLELLMSRLARMLRAGKDEKQGPFFLGLRVNFVIVTGPPKVTLFENQLNQSHL